MQLPLRVSSLPLTSRSTFCSTLLLPSASNIGLTELSEDAPVSNIDGGVVPTNDGGLLVKRVVDSGGRVLRRRNFGRVGVRHLCLFGHVRFESPCKIRPYKLRLFQTSLFSTAWRLRVIARVGGVTEHRIELVRAAIRHGDPPAPAEYSSSSATDVHLSAALLTDLA